MFDTGKNYYLIFSGKYIHRLKRPVLGNESQVHNQLKLNVLLLYRRDSNLQNAKTPLTHLSTSL
jgi:hypothetical protein